MSLWDTVRGFFRVGNEEQGSSSNMHIIDTTRLINRNGGRDRLSPRDQFSMLQQLAGFVEKEQLRACALLEGRPLREVADQSTYKGLQVFYAEKSDALKDIALEQARKHRNALLITQDRDLENEARSVGIKTMRTTTLRKALEENGGRSDNGKSSGGGRGRRRTRGGRRGGGSRQKQQQNQKQPQQKQQNEKPAKEARDGVSDLIDLV